MVCRAVTTLLRTPLGIRQIIATHALGKNPALTPYQMMAELISKNTVEIILPFRTNGAESVEDAHGKNSSDRR
jgi:hypothetical protein